MRHGIILAEGGMNAEELENIVARHSSKEISQEILKYTFLLTESKSAKFLLQ